MNRRNRIVQKSWKDYIIPVLGVLLVFLLIVSFFGSKGETPNKPVITKDALEVSVNENVDAYVIHAGDKQTKIESSAQLFASERLYVKSGTLESTAPNFKLGQFGDLRYDSKNNYSLFSSNLWLNPLETSKVEMRFLSVDIPSKSVVSMTQNDAASNVYVLSGSVVVKNSSGTKEITLNAGQKVSVFLNEAKKEDLDLLAKVESIPEYILEEDWYVKNNAKEILAAAPNTSTEGTEGENGDTVNEGEVDTNNSSYIMINTEDGASISKDEIVIEGELLKPNISKIAFNNIDSEINKEENIFKLENFKLEKGENDIVYKVYGEDNVIVSKGVLTVYNTSEGSTGGLAPEVTSYPINAKYGFNISNPLTTTASFVTIKGFVPADTVEYIKVNNYRLTKYIPGSTSWRYHADSTYDLLKDGINLYNVEYFDKDNKKITESLFIIKKVAPITTPVKPTSPEAN
ncbi:MAG: hypothetical protein N4A38_00030 [Candidatus Gracilibacteria bacterium]|nr:hypothetical protein [Candidatus Gracilibacteria bacterium]